MPERDPAIDRQKNSISHPVRRCADLEYALSTALRETGPAHVTDCDVAIDGRAKSFRILFCVEMRRAYSTSPPD